MARFDGEWEEIESTYGVAQRDSALLAINVAQARRPWFGRKQTHSYEIELGTSGQQPQRLKGAVHIKPRIPMWATVFGTLLCLSMLLFGSWYMRNNHGWLAFFDSDGDSLSDGSELYQYKTDPLLVDTDGDNLPDPLELLLGTNATVADTDGDGLIDSREQLPLERINLANWDEDQDGRLDGQELVDVETSDVFLADTDQDGFSDGLEADTCNDPLFHDDSEVMVEKCGLTTTEPEIVTNDVANLVVPVILTGTVTLTPTQVLTQHATISLVAGSDPQLQHGQLAIGDFENGDQQRTVLTFGAANLPQSAQIYAVELQLAQDAVVGNPQTLGTIWVDVAAGSGFGGELEVSSADFDAPALLSSVAQLHPQQVGEDEIRWIADLRWAAERLHNTTQLRLWSSLATNRDAVADQITFAPIDAEATLRPRIIIYYSYEEVRNVR